MKCIFSLEAEKELRDSFQYYSARASISIGESFANEVRRVVQLVAANPNLGTKLTRNYRSFPLNRFPYNVVYKVEASQLTVIAIAHNRRMQAYWRRKRPHQ